MIYATLFDLFNQNFTCIGDKEFAIISAEISKDFHAIVIIVKNQIENFKLAQPFSNRFEKHIVNFKILLEKKCFLIAQKIYDFI